MLVSILLPFLSLLVGLLGVWSSKNRGPDGRLNKAGVSVIFALFGIAAITVGKAVVDDVNARTLRSLASMAIERDVCQLLEPLVVLFPGGEGDPRSISAVRMAVSLPPPAAAEDLPARVSSRAILVKWMKGPVATDFAKTAQGHEVRLFGQLGEAGVLLDAEFRFAQERLRQTTATFAPHLPSGLFMKLEGVRNHPFLRMVERRTRRPRTPKSPHAYLGGERSRVQFRSFLEALEELNAAL